MKRIPTSRVASTRPAPPEVEGHAPKLLGHALPGQAVVLCGGRGRRLGALTDRCPKPLLEVQGRPILGHVIRSLRAQGVRRFVLPTGYLGAEVARYAGSLERELDVQITCVPTGIDTPIAGRLGQARRALEREDAFLMVNGDTLFDLDLGPLARQRAETGSVVTLASVPITSPYGLLHEVDGRLVDFTRDEAVRAFETGDGTRAVIHSGIALLANGVFDHFDPATCGSFEAEVYRRLIELGALAHVGLEGFWFCIDTPRDLERSQLLHLPRQTPAAPAGVVETVPTP